MTTTGPVVDRQVQEFYAADYARIVASIAAKFRDDDLAHEAVDEAVTRAWARLKGGESVDCLAAWVRTVATNVALDRIRRRASEARAVSTAVRALPVEQAPVDMDVELDVDVRRALAELPSRQREIATLHLVHELTYTEIASELGVSKGYVRKAIFKSRRAIIAALTLTAVIVAAIMLSSEQGEPVHVDNAPNESTPTSVAPESPGNEIETVAPEVVDEETAEEITPPRADAPTVTTTPNARSEVPGPSGAATNAPGSAVPAPAPAPAAPIGTPTAPSEVRNAEPTQSSPEDTPAPSYALPGPPNEPDDVVTVTIADGVVGLPYREVISGGPAARWTTVPRDVTLRLQVPSNAPAAVTLYLDGVSLSPAQPPNYLPGWVVTVAPGEVLVLQAHLLHQIVIAQCLEVECRLAFFDTSNLYLEGMTYDP